MPCLLRLATLLATALLVVLLAIPTSAGQRSDARLFAIAQEEQTGQDEAFVAAWDLYQSALSASEKATALNDVEAAITESERRIAALEVRPCFRPWHRAVTDMWSLLAKAVGSIRTGAVMTPDEIGRGSALLTLTRGGALGSYFVCKGGKG